MTSFDPAQHPRGNSGQFAAKTKSDPGQLDLTSPVDADAIARFGPHGVHVAALIDRAERLTAAEAERLAEAWNAVPASPRNAARNAAWEAAWNAAYAEGRYAAWDAARYNARVAAGNAAGALVVRGRISTEHYDTLTRPWRTTIGPIHPDDPDLA